MSSGTMKRSTPATPANESALPAKARASRDPFNALREEMNDLITRFWGGNQLQLGTVMTPAIDVSEMENAYEVRVDMPGMKAEDFDIQVQGNIFRVSGKRSEEKEEKNATYHCVERQSGSFSRTVTLPSEINEDEVAAEYVNGVLTLKLPKCEQSKSKKITVKS